MARSYAARLALAFGAAGVAGAILTALAVNLAFGGILSGYLNQQQDARRQQVVSLLAESYQQNGGWSTEALDALAPSLMMQGANVNVEDASGRLVWSLAQSTGPGMMGGLGRRMLGGTALGTPQDVAVTVGGARVGTAVIQLPPTGSLPADTSFRDAVNRLLIAGGLLAGLAAALIGVLLARRAVVPVRELTLAANELAAGRRESRLEQRSGDEFGAMAAAFNSMADSIAEEDRLRRSFAADVAHELRTPLMILGGQLEAIEDGLVKPDAAAIASLQEETGRMARLVSDLEVLASADAAHFSLERRPFDLGREARAAAAEFAPLFERKGVELGVAAQEARVDGDAARLRQVAANLLSNALKFTPPGGRVELSVRKEGEQAVLEVADSGPGIPPAELGSVFERFYRGEGARAGGSGIGLTVVRELVAAHGGDVTAANRPRGGALLTVRLPALAPSRRSAAAAGRSLPQPRSA